MGRPSCVRVAILVLGLLAFGMEGFAETAGKDATGTWKCFVGPRPADDRLGTLELKQEGDKLTGKFTIPGTRSVEIKDGKVTDDEIFFVIQPGPNAPKIYHKGKIDGDTIKGKTELERPGKPKQPHFDWEANRVPG